MTTKTSRELKAEVQTNFYGINPGSLRVECVSVTRGGMLTHWHAGKWPRTFRIRGGKAARAEIERVFHLTDIIAIGALKDSFPGEPDHPAVMVLQLLAAKQRRVRDGRSGSVAREGRHD